MNESKNIRNIDDKTAYMFFIDGETENKGRDYSGYMPRDEQFAYIFTSSFSENDEMYLAAAHELGHGKFVLQHTFHKDYKLPQGKTDNLMDYTPGARHIAKWQWDLMHDPGIVMRVFERDKDAMRKDEAERSQITRFMFAIKDVIQKDHRIKFTDSEFLISDDIKTLNSKKSSSVKADHIFYNELLSDYFEEVELKIFFNAAKMLSSVPNELSTLSQKEIPYKSWFIKDLDAVIAFVFKQKNDIPKFMEFLGEKDVLTPPQSSTRKAFFVHGTIAGSERWTEHPLTKTVLLSVANTDKYDDKFNWKEYNHLTNNIIDRNKAAQNLVDYVIKNSQGYDEIVLIGHSHGGNVSLQAVNQLVNKGKTVYLITVATPAYNAYTVEIYNPDPLQNCEFIRKTVKTTTTPVGGYTISDTYEYKNPENPTNAKLTRHIHLWNKEDKTAGGIALGSDDFYKNNVSSNIEIPTKGEYDYSFWKIYKLYNENLLNAHGFDANRPQLIYEMFLNGTITKIE
jgi:hypothetical protein